MKQIKQTAEVTFVAPTLKDAIMILPIMDGLVSLRDQLKEYKNGEEQKKWNYPEMKFGSLSFKLEEKTIESMLHILGECGFASTLED